LSETYWGATVADNGHLLVQGTDVVELARRHGTPLHVVNEIRLLQDYSDFLAPFRSRYPHVRLATSYKTNPVPAVLTRLHRYGTMAEVISHFELWLALHLGVDPSEIVLNGPGKTEAAMRLALERRIGLINLDGIEEIRELERLCEELRATDVTVGVRLTTSVGWQSQFGLSIANGLAEQAFGALAASKVLCPRAVHIHLGTGIDSVDEYREAVEEVVVFARAVEDKYGLTIDTYDLGGGFGVPTVRFTDEWDARGHSFGYPDRTAVPEDAPTPAAYAAAILEILERLAGPAMAARRLRVILEPGRAITSSAQMLLLSVVRRKAVAPDRRVLIVDGGKNVALPLGWEAHAILPADDMDGEPAARYDIYGPLCHPGDVIGRNVRLPPRDSGQLLAIMDAGAYFIPNQLNFSNARPPVVLIEDGQPLEVRSREEFPDVVRLDDFRLSATERDPTTP